MLLEILPPQKPTFASVLELLQLAGVTKISLPDKSKQSGNLEFAEFVKANSSLEILPHYSVQYHHHRRLESIAKEFDKYVLNCLQLGISEVLLVSGSRSQRHGALNLLEVCQPPIGFKIHVAFNPYLENIDDEITKLNRKLPFADGVFLQIGENLERLEKVLIDIPQLKTKNLYGCLLYPTRRFQVQFRFRPWKGVCLSKRYLTDLDYAQKVFRNYASFYRQHRITPLLEIQPLHPNHLQTALGAIKSEI